MGTTSHTARLFSQRGVGTVPRRSSVEIGLGRMMTLGARAFVGTRSSPRVGLVLFCFVFCFRTALAGVFFIRQRLNEVRTSHNPARFVGRQTSSAFFPSILQANPTTVFFSDLLFFLFFFPTPHSVSVLSLPPLPLVWPCTVVLFTILS